MHPGASNVVVRPVASDQDCLAVVELTGSNFPEECGTAVGKGGAGLNLREWSDLEYEDLRRQPWIWPHIGLAVEQTPQGDKVLGAVVLSFENQKDGTLSYWEISKRVGWQATVHNYLYEQVLEEPLEDHECLIDFIAVSPDSRGKGVGALLMGWAESTGVEILMKQWPEAVAAHGPLMSLWVAADNAAALKLYTRSGYTVVKQTDDGLCHCIMSRLLKSFLGHPVWYKMSKPLDRPPSLPTVQPPVISIPVAVPLATVTMVAAVAAAASLPPRASPHPTHQASLPKECTLRIPAHNSTPVALPPPVVLGKVAVAPLLLRGAALDPQPSPPEKPLPLAGSTVVDASSLTAGGEVARPSCCSGGSGRRCTCCSSGGGGDATAVPPAAAQASPPAPLLLQQLVASTLRSSVAAASLAATVVGSMAAAELEGAGACQLAPGPMSPAVHVVPAATASV